MMELAGARVCVQQGTTSELNLQDFNNQNKLDLEVITFETGPPPLLPMKRSSTTL